MATKRIKPKNVIPVRSLPDVDDHLFKIAQMRTHLKRIDADAEEEINNIRERAAKVAEPLKDEIEKLEAGIFAFSEMEKNTLFTKAKSVELNFGFIGYRQSTKISIKASTVDKLREMGLQDAILIKESANKDIMATYPDEILKQADAKRIVEDNFWYEVKEEEITQKTAKQIAG